MSIFEERNFNQDERNSIKLVIEDVIETMNSINDLQEHMKENVKGLCDRLNENVATNDQKIKTSVIMKMAKTKMKEDMAEQKEKLSEVEVGLELVYGR
jgi:uncharacterized protein YoxC